jgi:PAS domain S-box-containing protein
VFPLGNAGSTSGKITANTQLVTLDSDSARFSQALRAAVLWPVGIILLTALLLVLLIFMLFHVVGWSDQSFAVLEQARTCENLSVSSQNNVRGYLLTGDPSFVSAFNSNRTQIGPAVEQLKSLVQDNPEQVIRAENIIQSENTWLGYGQNMIAQRTKSVPINLDWVKEGKMLMDGVTGQFDKFADTEEGLRDKRLRNVARMKEAVVYIGSVLIFLLAVTVAQVVRKQMTTLAENYRTALKTIEQRHAELMRSEADLEEQKEWLSVTLTSIGDGVIVSDPESRVVMMNHEAERLTGWPMSEALHQPLTTIFKIINEQTRVAVDNPVAKVLLEKKVVGLANHTVLLSRTGEEWPIEDSAAPICNAKKKILGVVMVFHDATVMRQAQNSLKAYSLDLEKVVADRTNTLQQAVSELEAFSYTISHDLRSPLRAMQGFSEAVLEDYGDKIDARGKNYLERIKNAAARLDRLIQDLLSFTRISRQDVPLEPIDLSRILHDIIENYPNLNPPAAEVHIEGNLPKVLGREAPLTQVLSNLLGNAARFVKPETAPHIRVWGEDRGPRFRLWIEDNGVGIAPQDHERIFQMFVQVNEPERFGGTGVGLAIVKKAVETMHGTVGVESQEGTGSKFWVELNKST